MSRPHAGSGKAAGAREARGLRLLGMDPDVSIPPVGSNPPWTEEVDGGETRYVVPVQDALLLWVRVLTRVPVKGGRPNACTFVRSPDRRLTLAYVGWTPRGRVVKGSQEWGWAIIWRNQRISIHQKHQARIHILPPPPGSMEGRYPLYVPDPGVDQPVVEVLGNMDRKHECGFEVVHCAGPRAASGQRDATPEENEQFNQACGSKGFLQELALKKLLHRAGLHSNGDIMDMAHRGKIFGVLDADGTLFSVAFGGVAQGFFWWLECVWVGLVRLGDTPRFAVCALRTL